MKQKTTSMNLWTTFLLAMSFSIVRLIINLFEVSWHFPAVGYEHYYLIVTALISFFLSFQIVTNMNIKKKTNSYYLSILGVNFIMHSFFILFTAIIFALFS